MREGTFGDFGAEVATPLAMVLTELVQNAVEHGFAGTGGPGRGPAASGSPARCGSRSRTTGVGLPEGFDLDELRRLGLQIVRTLVEASCGGTLELGPREGGGTRAVDRRAALTRTTPDSDGARRSHRGRPRCGSWWLALRPSGRGRGRCGA